MNKTHGWHVTGTPPCIILYEVMRLHSHSGNHQWTRRSGLTSTNLVSTSVQMMTSLGMPNGLSQEMISFDKTAIRDRTLREDHRELLQLCLVFLGKVDGNSYFHAPGAMDKARWMSI